MTLRKLGSLLPFLVFLGSAVQPFARDSDYEWKLKVAPSPVQAGHPAAFHLVLSHQLGGVDPLLGTAAPIAGEVSFKIVKRNGSPKRIAGPFLFSSRSGRSGTMSASYRFEDPGSFLLVWTLLEENGQVVRFKSPLEVAADPHSGVLQLVVVLFCLGSIGLLLWNFRSVPRTAGGIVKAAGLTATFLILCGLLVFQFLVPAFHQFADWDLQEESLPASDVIPVTQAGGWEILTLNTLAAAGPAPHVQVTVGPLEVGVSQLVTVTVRSPDGALTGESLAGKLQPVPGIAVPLEGSHSQHVEPGHGLEEPALAEVIPLHFHRTVTGEFEALVIPETAGKFDLSLRVQTEKTVYPFTGAGMIGIEGSSDQHALHASSVSFESLPLWWVAVALLFLTVLFHLWMWRRGTERKEPTTLDLFAWDPLYRLFRWRHFQTALWIPNLILFALVIYLGIWDTQVGGRNLATKLTWTIWWAAIIFAFVLVGKLWCAMCPFGALTIWTSRFFGAVRKLPRFLRNLWIANLAFIFVTWADDFWGIVSTPRLTVLLVIVVAVSAIVVGRFFERATFCRHMCPIGGLIGVYSMFSGMELRARDPAVCRSCRGKECYRGSEDLPGCPMLQFPATLDRNNYCTLCGDCVKACPSRNLSLRLRPFAQDIWKSTRRHFDEAYLVIALVGLTFVVTGHMIEPWHAWLDWIAAWIPWQLVGISSHAAIESWTFTLVYVVGVLLLTPGLLVAASAVASSAGTENPPTGQIFRAFAYMFIPIGIGLHLAHNLLHLIKEGGGIIPVIQRAVDRFTPFQWGRPDWSVGPLLSDPVIYWIQLAVLTVLYLASLYCGYRIAFQYGSDRKNALRLLAPMILLALAFTLVNVFLLSQPMSQRHHH